MKTLKMIFFPLIPLALVFITLLPLFHTGFFTIHDDEQIARLYDLHQAILNGNIPPRIAPNLGYGYGYPFFNFYPPFAYYVGEFFHFFGFGYILSTKLMVASGFFLSAFFMYLLSREIFGKWEAMVSSTAYVFIPYHAVDVYVRGAFAEFYAFVFLPLIFWSLIMIQRKQKVRYVIFGSLGVAGLILSHNLVAFMSTPFIAIWLLYNISVSKNKQKFLLSTATLFLVGFGLSAYFFLPSYVERGYTLVNILTSELADYKLHFVCTHQLWDSPWGYGGSIPGCYDGISFEIGKIQLLLSIVAGILAIASILKKKNKEQSKVILISLVLLGAASFLMIKYSKPVWDAIPPLWYVQFPWRFLLFTSFFSSFLSAGVVWFVKPMRLKMFIAGIALVMLVIFSFSIFTPQRFFNISDAEYTSSEKIRWETSNLAYEYTPKGIKTKKSKENTTQIDIAKDEIAQSSYAISEGEMLVQELENKPQQKRFKIQVVKDGIFRINTFSFPGWVVLVNNVKTSFTDKNKLKLIDVPLKVGTYSLEAKFLDTPIRTAGNVATLISIILLLGIIVFSQRRKIL